MTPMPWHYSFMNYPRKNGKATARAVVWAMVTWGGIL